MIDVNVPPQEALELFKARYELRLRAGPDYYYMSVWDKRLEHWTDYGISFDYYPTVCVVSQLEARRRKLIEEDQRIRREWDRLAKIKRALKKLSGLLQT